MEIIHFKKPTSQRSDAEKIKCPVKKGDIRCNFVDGTRCYEEMCQRWRDHNRMDEPAHCTYGDSYTGF